MQPPSPATTPPVDASGEPLRAHPRLAGVALEAERIFARYGLAEPHARKVVDEAWKERLRKDPALYQDWQRLYRMFSDR
ncbi:MAG TPA: hypothetical protein VM694_06335 [Polyangium sp.]|nr:hypothetical protein [Polyangium sp.]